MILRGMTGTLKTSPQSFCDCLLPAHAASGPDVTAQSLRCLASEAQSLRCPPSLLRHPFAFRTGKAATAAHVLIWPTAAPLVGNSPRGWAPKTLPNPEVRGVEPTKQSRAREVKVERGAECELRGAQECPA